VTGTAAYRENLDCFDIVWNLLSHCHLAWYAIVLILLVLSMTHLHPPVLFCTMGIVHYCTQSTGSINETFTPFPENG
jgi:hypothetical protein